MEEVVQTYVRDKTFMGAVLVARGSDVILSKGYGSANLEWDIPNTPATKFRLGSITKQFTAAAILALIEDGTIGGGQPNAADFQILASVRVLLEFDDLGHLLEGRACAPAARLLYPEWDGPLPRGLPLS